MLSSKTLKVLIVLCGLCALTVGYFVWKEASSKNKYGLFLPNLLKNHAQISQIILENDKHTVTIARGTDSWQIVEHGNFPVLREKVEELIFALADLEIIEPKTTNPEYYKQLGVEDISKADADTTQITILDDQQNTLAKVLIGIHEGLTTGEEYQEFICVRKVDDPQTWLVQGTLPFSLDFGDWVEQPLLGIIDTDQIKALSVLQPKADKVVISRANSQQEDFTLSTLKPKKGRTLDLDAVNTLPFTVAELEFIDVIPANTTTIDWQSAVQAKLESFTGVTIALNIIKQHDKVLAKVSAIAAQGAPEDIQTKVKDFNNAKQAWLYELPEDFYHEITTSNAEFMKAA